MGNEQGKTGESFSSSLLLAALTKTMSRSNLEDEKVYFVFHFTKAQLIEISQGGQDRNLRTGTLAIPRNITFHGEIHS